jgi:uncharacterized protein YebE (UPF0316 family)
MVELIGTAVLIFVMRVIGNMLTTLRLIMNTRGCATESFVIAVIESLIFALVLGVVLQNLDSVINLAAYSVGFGVGGYVALQLERLFIRDYIEVTVISIDKGLAIAEAIRDEGMGATETEGHGAHGDVLIIKSIIERRQLNRCLQAIHGVDPKVFVTTHSLRGYEHGVVSVQPGLSRLFFR